jgi:hypothetical protein
MPPSTLGLVLIGVGDFSAGPGGLRSAGFDGIAPLTTIAVDPKTQAIAGNTIPVTPGANHGVSATLSWQSVTPTNAPVDDDAR